LLCGIPDFFEIALVYDVGIEIRLATDLRPDRISG
jgi:hypothetical protein